MSSATEKVSSAADAAEAVKSTADVAADTVTIVSDAASKDANIDKGLDLLKKAGDAYHNTGGQAAGNVMDKLFGGVTNLFKSLRKISKDVEEGGAPAVSSRLPRSAADHGSPQEPPAK